MPLIDEIFALYHRLGRTAYRGGEQVSQLAHALQTGFLAEQAGAGPALVTAALLHDYGHYLHDMDAGELALGRNDHHEEIDAAYLSRHFPQAVTAPIALHVEAKRFLCATDPAYHARLTPGARFSLKIQGGRHSSAEAEAFAQRPFATDAARLRRWDDAAKAADLETPDLEHFRTYLAACMD